MLLDEPVVSGMAVLVSHMQTAVTQSRERLYQRASLMAIVGQLYDKLDHQSDKRASAARPAVSERCVVCYCDFDQDETKPAALPSSCGGGQLVCCGCLAQYIESRVQEGDVVPWIPTPAEKNDTPLPPEMFEHCSDSTLCQFCVGLVSQLLARESDWMACSEQNCHFGFTVHSDEKQRRRCEACGIDQIVSRNAMDTDKELQQLVRDGVVRMCPSCGDPNMKDYGICNVIQCAKCSIWWNWESRETGNSSRELKEKARRVGNLWLPGELAFQQNLERNDKRAFKDLLEKNGVQYDPNYHRGGHAH